MSIQTQQVNMQSGVQKSKIGMCEGDSKYDSGLGESISLSSSPMDSGSMDSMESNSSARSSDSKTRPKPAEDMDSFPKSRNISHDFVFSSESSYFEPDTDTLATYEFRDTPPTSMDSGVGSMSTTGSFTDTASYPEREHNRRIDDSGVGSSMTSTLTSSSSEGLTYAQKSRKANKSSKQVEKSFFMGTFIQFLAHLKANVGNESDSKREFKWESWDPVKHIKNCLTDELLAEARDLLWGQSDADKEFELLNAARDQDENLVAFGLFIADSHKQLNTMNADRQTVLHIAAEVCSPQLVRLLITRGCDGAIADVWGDTPLHIAARHGRAEVIKMLTTTLTKPEVHHPYFRVPYKSLPQDNVQSFNHDGRTPIHLAAQNACSPDHIETLRALVKYARADIDYRRLGDGYAPAHIAIDNDDYACLKKCLELGADSEVRNYKSETPQQLAYLCDRPNMVELCQNYGAGSYQLLYARTEPVSDDDEDMDVDDEDEKERAIRENNLLSRMERMAVGY